MILDSTILKLEAVLAGAITTNQPEVHVDYFVWNNKLGETTTKPATFRTALNSTTDVTILAAPASPGYVFEPFHICIYNKDTVAITVIVKTDNGTTEYIQVKQTIASLKSLIWERGVGWYVV